VSQACAVVRRSESGDGRLVAYFVVTRGAAAPSSAELLESAQRSLPDYMVPAAFVQLDALPMTPNGKVDRSALPAPPRTRPELATPWAAPENDQQEAICGIWAEVLDIDRVGLHDDFLELGGHSLLATQVVTRVGQTLGAQLPIAAVLGGATPAELAARIESEIEASGPEAAIPRVPREGDLPLSFSQERAWFMQKLAPDSQAYQAQAVLYFDGALDVAVLERCLTEITRRHEIYRTSFPERDGQPVQVIHPPEPCELEVVDLGHVSHDSRTAEAERLVREACDVHFDLTRLPLIQWTLFRVDAEHHVMLHVEHHIVHDGWSYRVFLDELAQLYRAYVAGGQSPLPDLQIQFADFAKWQRDWMETDAAREQLEFWKQRLAGCPAELPLPYDRERPRVPSFDGAAPRVRVSAELRRRVTELAHRERATLFGAGLTAYFVLMHRYSQQDDLCIGTGIANRVRRETEPLMGMFINTVTLRCDLSGDPTFRELLAQVRSVLLAAHAHQDVPFDRVVDAVVPSRDTSRNPLFQVLFSFQDAPVPDLELPGVTLRVLEGQTNGSAKFDLNVINFLEDGLQGGGEVGGIDMVWEYATDLFDAGTIERFASDFVALLEAVADDPDTRLSRLVVPSDEERQRLLDWGHGPSSGAPAGRTVHELFAARAAASPDAVAVAFGEERLTYAELDARSNQLAHHLLSLGVKPEECVGIAVERSLEMVVGVLGILKAGGAYVPLDTGYPEERLTYMLENAGVRLLVTLQHLESALPAFDGTVLRLDADADAVAPHPKTAPRTDAEPDSLAYVIYTSGSTGQPKGVLVEHRSIARLVLDTNYVTIGEDDVFIQAAPLAFDASTFEIWGSLLNGARLEIPPAAQPSLEELGQAIASRGVTTIFITTALFRQLVEFQLTKLAGVRQLLMGGETTSLAPVQRILATLDGDRRFIHCYGPTENTTFTTCHVMTSETPIGRSVPIGIPIAGTQVYVLDGHMQPVPVGVPGRLWTGGEGVARGYLGDEELTAKKFIPDPFSDDPDARLYDTGDDVRWLADGTLEFMGRRDEQVKIHGHRIELGEIETAFARHDGVSEVAVVAREDRPGERRLVAYVVPRDGAQHQTSELKKFVSASLPAYMVPTLIVSMDALPLTANGKLDRRALPEPRDRQVDHVMVEPRNELEAAIARLWADLLQIETMGVTDSFFELGGDSLLAMRAISRLRDELHVELSLADFFEDPTIAGWVERVDVVRWLQESQELSAVESDEEEFEL
jgi:amino acid adenylation domain-containing protein